MVEVAYVPTSEYNIKLDTPITRFPYLSGIVEMGIRRIITSQLDGITIPTNTLLYTVPEGKSLFIFSYTVQTFFYTSTGRYHTNVNFNLVEYLFASRIEAPDILQDRAAQEFATPIKLRSGEKIYHTVTHGGANGSTIASIVAYEIDDGVLKNLA